MRRTWFLGAALALSVVPAAAQTPTINDPALRAIWDEGMNNSQLVPLAQGKARVHLVELDPRRK